MRKVKSLAKVSYPAPDVVTKMVPAPTDGWDAITPLAEMPATRAPILKNWVPRTGWCELRAGFETYVVNISSSSVDSLMVWRGASSQKMFAATNGKIWDVSSIVSPVPSIVVSGLGNNRWQYTNFTPAGGTNVIQLVNGVDAMRQYNGTAWSSPTISGLPSGITTASFVNIYAQKRRLWYIPINSSVAIFMPVDAISGAIAGTLDLGALFTKGGYLVSMTSWTLDGGSGPSDYAAFISSRGQVAIYSGTDPADATAWSLVGVFNISPPVGRRCATGVGSDVALITLQGVVPLSQALPFDPSADRSVAITARIQNAMQQATMQGKDNFGWEFITYPAQALAILNVPLVEAQTQVQYVTNMLTGAWCQFTGWNANCFAIFNEQLYWGGNSGQVNLGYAGSLDGDVAIDADMQCAFNYFDDPGRLKRMTMVQPFIVAGGTLTPLLEVDTDFGTGSSSQAPISILGGNTLWDVAIWDQATWPSPTQTLTDWYSVEAVGHSLAVRMKLQLGAPDGLGTFDVGVFDTATFDVNSGDGVTLQVNAFNAIMEMGGFV